LTGALAFVAFHLHLLFDLAGSRGADGYQWPIPYLWPFSNGVQLSWEGQWMLSAWQNTAITIVLVLASVVLAWRQGYSPAGLVNRKADDTFVAALRARFGQPG
jgi:inner membrane protein